MVTAKTMISRHGNDINCENVCRRITDRKKGIKVLHTEEKESKRENKTNSR